MRVLRRTAAVLLLVTLAGAVGAQQQLPPLRDYVNDYAGVISPADEARITALARAIEEKTTIQIAVATVPSMAEYGSYGSIEEFSIDLATTWKLGQAGEDNGMLVVLAVAERRTRIEVGYGLEGTFTDGLVGSIMDRSMVPHFRNNDFSTGFVRAMEGMAGVIAEAYDVSFENLSMAESRKYGQSGGGGASIRPIIGFIVLFIVFGGGRLLLPMIFLGGMSSRRRGGFGTSSRGGFGAGGGLSGRGFSGGGGSFGGGGASRGF